MKPFQKRIRPEDVREIVDFGLREKSGQARYESMADLQSKGVAALYNILCGLNFAYLADEVGMGKTYQALGVAAVLWNLKPDARIVFISPRSNLQDKWRRDYNNFIRNNYRRPHGGTGDAVLKCLLRKEPLILPKLCNNLREFALSLSMPGRKVWFLRHTSFQRPLYLSLQDDAQLPKLWKDCRHRMRSCGLRYHSPHLPCKNAEGASLAFNIRFARALSKRLQDLGGSGEPAIDLLVVDEAQCLRHPANQANTVLREAFEGNVGKWLFLSATPVHTGRADVRNQINSYAQPGFISDEDLTNVDSLTQKMKKFLVRRPRKFVINAENNEAREKHQYRDHREEPAKCEEPLSALAMALVQKKLVALLDARNNRFRLGFLSSFESLQESIHSGERGSDDEENPTDFYEGKDEGRREATDRLPIDWTFITSLNRRFKEKFGEDKYLPHPKLDHTVALLSGAAFDGNQKFLVFCRRIRAVDELRRRLDQRWHQWIEQRMQDVWDQKNFDWRTQTARLEPEEPVGTDHETQDDLPEDAGFRNASAKGGWLYRYRSTFRDAGRNALVFQENWLRTICSLQCREFDSIVDNLPDELLQEAQAAATREYSGRQRLYPAEFLAYLATILVRKNPGLLGLDERSAPVWDKFLSTINAPLFNNRPRGDRPVRTDRQLLKNMGLWDMWNIHFADSSHPLRLGVSPDPSLDDLYQREILKNLIGQSYRLTDVLLDLYFAEQGAKKEPERFLSSFFEYLTGDTRYAQVLRERTAGWIQHFSIVLLNCFRSERNPSDLARMASMTGYEELNNQTAVVGITGGSGINERAIRQFKTPFYPQIIVCTDVLKEGEDLHVFCDQVVHYGVAWTSGDLEQRIGRVDRFFSQIERRLCESNGSKDVKLGICYPYLVDTLEKLQIDRVLARVRDAEIILDNFDISRLEESKEIAIDSDPEELKKIVPDQCGNGGHPFADVSQHIPKKGMKIVCPDQKEAERLAKNFREGGRLIARYLEAKGMAPDGEKAEEPSFYFNLSRNGDKVRCGVEWQFVHDLFIRDLGVYALRFLEPVPEEGIWADRFSFAYERREEKRGGFYRTHRLILGRGPSPRDIRDMFAQVVSYLQEDHVSVEDESTRLEAVRNWLRPIASLQQKWLKPHKAELTLDLSLTRQPANLYVYKNMLLLLSPVARIDGLDEEWFGSDGDRTQKIQNWCLDQNRQLTLGFLHVNSDGWLNFCERLFIGGLPVANFQDIVCAVVSRADMYKTFLTGIDYNKPFI
ncbi:MAG: helicase-related protein [Syntrophobacteraceae bacterium]